MSAACHRSLYGYQLRTALTVAIENRHAAVTFIPLACSGATIDAGLLGAQGASECPPTGRCAGTVPAQVAQLAEALTRARRSDPGRNLDLVLLTVGANDIKFSGLVADVTITSGVERVLFNQGGLIATVPDAQVLLDRTLPQNFARLRAALKPLVGGNLARVVYVSYGHPAMAGDQPCPGGRDGLDVHPSFNADGRKLRLVTDFVLNRFMPKLQALARCERGVVCTNAETDRMTFIDAHQDAVRAARPLRAFRERSGVRPRLLLARRQELRSRSGGGGDLAAGLPAPAERIPALRAARALDPHPERQLLHGDDVPARAAVDHAAEQHPRRDLGRAVGGLWRRVPSERRRPCGDGRRGAAGGARRAGAQGAGERDRAAAAAAAIGASESNQFLVASFRACAGFQQENC